MSGLEMLARRVIRLAIRDLYNGQVAAIESFIGTPTFAFYRSNAGYPKELDDTLVHAVVSSEIQRRKICQEIFSLLDQLERRQKETPASAGVPEGVITVR